MLTGIARLTASIVLATAGVTAIASSASASDGGPYPGSGAGGGVNCDPRTGLCQVTVTTPGSTGSATQPSQGSTSGVANTSGDSGTTSTPTPQPTLVNGTCTYAQDPTFTPQPGDGLDAHTGQKGAWYAMTCPDGIKPGTNIATTTTTMVWLPAPPPPPVALPTPAALAAQARKNLVLPKPVIASNPAVGRPQMVGIPMWSWMSPGIWSAVSASASVPGESVTATATPIAVEWNFGDGSSTTCLGPGTPFKSGGDPSAASPDCGHTYRTSSGNAPGGVFRVSATINWRVTWVGAGQNGTLNGMTTTSTIPVTVQQSQAIITGTG